MIRIVKWLIWLVVVAGLCWGIGFLWFLSQIPQEPTAETVRADAIVVLTGGPERLNEGLRLFTEGRAPALFISGVGQKATLEEILANTRYPQADGSAITLGHYAETTWGNAEETSTWVKERRYRSLILVSAHYHLPRALTEFRYELPDVFIEPHPVRAAPFGDTHWIYDTHARRVMVVEYHKFLAVQARRWIW